MSVVGEVVGVIACVAALVSAYRDSGDIIERIKKKRAERRAAPPSQLLKDSVDGAPQDIENEKHKGVLRFGKLFENGDHVAVIALQRITIELQGSLLAELKNAAYDDTVTDFRYLVDVADMGRDRTIDTLLQFKQRLRAAEPIHEIHEILPVKTIASSPPASSAPSSKPLPAPPRENPRHPPTWTAGYVSSGEVTGDEDTASGAENHPGRNRKRHSSLLGFFKHKRSPSGTKTPVVNPPYEEPPWSTLRDRRQSNRPMPSIPRSDSRSSASAVSMSSEHSASTDQTQKDTHQTHKADADYNYEPWEDDPRKIWGYPPAPEHRESVAVERQASPPASSPPTSMHRAPLAPTFTRSSSVAAPHPASDNEYLGFCKGAVKFQNGEKDALKKCKESIGDPYSRSGYGQQSVPYLGCCSKNCCFRSHIRVDLVWDKVFTVERYGLKFRWAFLAKSHVAQKVVQAKTYTFKCLFCVYAGEQSPVFQGMDLYMDHVSTHRGPAGEVVLWKAGCINDRICEDTEAFDINLFPPDTPDGGVRDASHMLSDDLMGLTMQPRAESVANDSMVTANEPWNAGLSVFHYGGDFERTELE